MSKDEKRWIVLFVAVVIIAIVLFVSLGMSKNKKQTDEEGTTVVQQGSSIDEKYVEVKDDGTKVNTSNKLKENKTFDGLNISNINIETKNNETVVKADITNSTN